MQNNFIQLEMNFNGSSENHFRRNLDEGIFQILIEVPAPSSDTKTEDAVKRYSEIEFAVMSSPVKIPACLAFTDPQLPGESMDVVTFASELCQHSRDAHLIYTAGRNRTIRGILDRVGHAYLSGFKNFCAVSGAAIFGETEKDVRSHVFQESVNILQNLRESGNKHIFTGCTVNPFKYTPCDNYLQYHKLVKKVSCGASFAVTQFGWDMKKLQELRWNLFRRSIGLSTIARFLFLTPERASALCAGKYPGTVISVDFEHLLKEEMEHSGGQFEAAQLRRLQIHAAGLRFLGYSGIQLSGIDRPELVSAVLQRIEEAFQEFQTFEEWRDAYNEYYGRLDMAPFPYRFYMFEDLFQTAHPGEELRIRDTRLPVFPIAAKKAFALARKLFSNADKLPAQERRLTKKVMCGCRGCASCRLPLTNYICPETCPKGFANGPCGCSKMDGKCQFTDDPCIFAKSMRLCNETNDYRPLEEYCVQPLDVRPK